MIDLGFDVLNTLDEGNIGGLHINNAGQVIGSGPIPGYRGDHAFLWTAAGGQIPIGPTAYRSSFARAVNEAGQVAGYDLNTGVFFWSSSGGTIHVAGHGFSYAAINNAGQVVGAVGVGQRAFSWTAEGGMVDLGTLGGANSYAYAVNDSGQVVGYSYIPGDAAFHAFSWTADGGMVDLGTLGGANSYAYAVNDSGQVVGDSSSSTSGNLHATMWLVAVTVESALAKLMDQITAYGLPHGLTNALTVKLEAALASWQRGWRNAAVNELGAFIHQVNAQRNKALTTAQADRLIGMAEQIVQAIKTGTAQ
jgi:probable HAF family extracellular repeat protein